MLEVTEEAALERERLLAEAFAAIRAVATVEPCRELAEMSQEKRDPLLQIFGRHATQSILLAKKPGRILWTDDFVQSSIAIKEYGARAAWSELIAAHLEGRGRIDRATAVNFVTRLLGYRYETVAITPAVLVNAARVANWDREKSPFSDALNPLANVPLDSSLFATIGAIATEMERDLEAESRVKLIAMICRTFLKRADGLRLLGLIRLRKLTKSLTSAILARPRLKRQFTFSSGSLGESDLSRSTLMHDVATPRRYAGVSFL